jgi:ABC-type transporter Mla subunit MlaD
VATRVQKTKVGLFLISCGLIVGGILTLISGYNKEELLPYWIEFDESVLGLSSGCGVVYLGVPVGTVKDIFVDESGKAHVEVLISPSKVTLHDGVAATLVLYSLATGTMWISLDGGDANAPVLLPGAEIPPKKSLITAVSKSVEETLAGAKEMIDKLNAGLDGMAPGDIKRVVDNARVLLEDGQTFVNNADTTMKDVHTSIKPALVQFDDLVKEFRELMKELNETVKVTKKKLEPMQLAETEKKIQALLENATQLSEKMTKTLGTVETATKTTSHEADNLEYGMRETMRALNETLEAVQQLTHYLKDDPSALVRGKGTPKRK